MRTSLLASLLVVSAVSNARAQNATVVARIVEQDSRAPLGFIEVSAPKHGIQRLTSESGAIVLRNLPAGEISLRFRRIGFASRDTVVTVAANDTAHIVIGIARLAIRLPTVLVEPCTNRTPFEPQTPIITTLFDQMKQNAERLVLLAKERPFKLEIFEERGLRGPGRTPTTLVFSRGPLPDQRYVPKRVVRYKDNVGYVTLPELADLADTIFTNNHCFRYAGQTRIGADSVIQVDFEPVPRLAKEADLEGSLYLRVDDYRLVEIVTRLKGIPRNLPNLLAYTARARFTELVSGIPVLAEAQAINTLRSFPEPMVVSISRVTGVQWLGTTRRDSVQR